MATKMLTVEAANRLVNADIINPREWRIRKLVPRYERAAPEQIAAIIAKVESERVRIGIAPDEITPDCYILAVAMYALARSADDALTAQGVAKRKARRAAKKAKLLQQEI